MDHEPFMFDAHGLRKGHLWLNGRALGRYWQIGPQEFYKVPAAWLQAENELLIFEEEDGLPQINRIASRRNQSASHPKSKIGNPKCSSTIHIAALIN